MESTASKVYVKVDANSRVVRCEGGYTTPNNLEGWIQIDEGIGDRYNLCQSQYFDGGLYTSDGIPRYKLQDGKPVQRTEEELQADRATLVSYIPSPTASATLLLKSVFASQVGSLDDETLLQCSGLADDWVAGKHTNGEIYNVENQTWECYQDYDNSVYPDIAPGSMSWYTFNRPLHGKSPETARPFVTVHGAHDMYKSGEYCIFTDEFTYRCKSDTNFSPSDYPNAWEKV